MLEAEEGTLIDVTSDESSTSSLNLLINDISFGLRGSIREASAIAESIVFLYNDVLFYSDLCPNLVSTNFVVKLITESVQEFSKAAMEQRACLDSAEFVLPHEVVQQDADDLRRLGSIENLVRYRHAQAENGRYSISRCNAVLGDCDPVDLARCRMLAIEGSCFPRPEGFVRQLTMNPMRSLATRLGNTYIKSAYSGSMGGL